MVRDHPAVASLLSTGLERLLEQGIFDYSLVCPVDADPGHVGRCQVLLGFLGLEVFLS